MIFKQHGNKDLPVFILLHGGGLAEWSLARVVERLAADFCVVTPVIDGHGEDAGTTFTSIEDSAEKLVGYIQREHGGQVFAMGGLSLGAQITVEVLSRQADIARFAVIESALVVPIPGAAAWAGPTFSLLYGLVRQRWFARLQAKSLLVPDEQFEIYYRDSARMSRQSLVNITLSNAAYRIKPGLRHSQARVLILAGEKELRVMRKSAYLLGKAIPDNEVFIVPGMKHGELSLRHPDTYVRLVNDFFARQS